MCGIKTTDRRKVVSFRAGNKSFIFAVMPGNCTPTRTRYHHVRIRDISHAGCCAFAKLICVYLHSRRSSASGINGEFRALIN